MKKILLIIVLLGTSYIVCAQYPRSFVVVPESPKKDFSSFLSGVRTWEFHSISYNGKDMTSANGGDFGYAYVIKEIMQWMSATLPDAEHGIDFNNKSTTHLWVDVSWSTSYYLDWNYNYRWTISSFHITLYDAGIGYKYMFNIPDLYVKGNDFNNHKLFKSLRENITQYEHPYRRENEMNTMRVATSLKESSIIDNISSPIEGIYEDIISSDGGRNNKYKLGLTRVEGKLYLIYLSGCNLWDDWIEGDLKATLEETSSPNIYRSIWKLRDKAETVSYITFDNNRMEVVIDGVKSTYLKLFPQHAEIPYTKPLTWTGTGFALEDGYAVTNYHVIEGAKTISLKGIDGDSHTSYSAIVVTTDKKNDIAILKINDSRFDGFESIPYSVSLKQADVGEDVFVLGYPLTQALGNEIKLTNGIISARSGYQGDISTYQISAPVQYGNSGAPMFDGKGNIIGIVNAGVPGADNVGYAIKTLYLKVLIENSGINIQLPTNNTISALSLAEKAKRVKNYIFYIECSR